MSHQKVRSFWVEGNPFAPNLHCAATFEVPSTSACEIIHVIEYSEYEKLRKLVDKAEELFKETRVPNYISYEWEEAKKEAGYE